jgi:hypothetical protein
MDEPDPPRLTPAERIFVRISLLQTVLAVIGIFTGAVALVAALNEADAVRKQLYASVWPRIETGSDRWSRQAVERREEFAGLEGPLFRFTVLNSGIGPARVQSVRLRVDGKAQQTWAQALEAITGRTGISFGSSTIGRRVIRAGDLVNAMTLLGEPAQILSDAFADPEDARTRVVIEICYCSVFDECWITADESSSSEPQPVDQCPDFGDEQFRE